MALEGVSEEDLAALEKQLLKHIPDSSNIGNTSLMKKLNWEEDRYWNIRNRLLERGVLIRGRGQGGSVRRVPPVAEIDPKKSAAQISESLSKESDLYAPMLSVIRNRWAQDFRLDSVVVELTALGGSKPTKGKWTRPDITLASYKTYAYVPGRHFDLITFEVKPSSVLDVTVIYEALGHRRSATRSYALIHVPVSERDGIQPLLDDIALEAKRHGIGVIVAGKPDDYETWEELVEAVRYEPDPERLNDFLSQQVSQGFREQISKWFK